MQLRNFFYTRTSANYHLDESKILVTNVTEFWSQPTDTFTNEVTVAENRYKELNMKLDDLNDQTQTARRNVAEATQLYFENRDPDASNKAFDIKAMKAAARANVKFGNELLDDANGNVTQANDAFRRYLKLRKCNQKM